VYKRQIYQIAESNRLEKIDSVARIESNRIETFFARIGMLYYTQLHIGLYLSRRRPTQTLLIMPMEIYEVTHIFTTFTNVFSYFGMLLMFLSLNKKFT